MKLSVLYGCDDNYAPYTGVSMTSLFENNKDVEEITVYLAAMGFSKENRDKFQQLEEQYKRKIVFLDTDKAVATINEYGCGSWNGSVAAWLRLFVLDQILEHVEKLIWIDSDTIVGPGIKNIINTISEGNWPVAAVCDFLAIRERYRLGFLEDEPYFNSGVIIFNMLELRHNKTFPVMMSYIRENVRLSKTADQDMLNLFFGRQIHKLPPKYNMQCFIKAYKAEDYFAVYQWSPEAFYSKQEMIEAIENPVISHFLRFLGDYPWTNGKNYHPAKKIYEEWKSKSLWKDHLGAPPRKEIAFQVEKKLFQILPRRTFLRLFFWYTNRKSPRTPQ